jgi:transposase
MKHYAGLDVSMKETSICIVDKEGTIVYQGQEKSNPDKIARHLKSINLSLEKVAIESGSLSHWLVSELQELGIPAICVDAKHISSVLSMKINKTDQNDAHGIADALRCGYYREVFLKSQSLVETGTLLQSRAILVQERTKIKNAIRGLLKSYGIKVFTTGKKIFSTRVKELIQDRIETVKAGIEALLLTFDLLDEQVKNLEEKLQRLAKDNEDVKILTTIPGVGLITALSFLVSLGDFKRFEDSRNVGAYLGLTPRQYSSGEVQRQGKISKCGPRQTRSLLVEAAVVMLTRTRSWSKPKAWAMKLQKKKGFKKAAVALARKLSVIMHRMLITREAFRLGDLIEKQERSIPKKKIA